MNPLLADMPLFVEVAKRKSFTRAAQSLGLGIATLSRRIKLLEKKLGVPLLQRDTHMVELTDAGSALLEHCEFILEISDHALESVLRNLKTPAGKVRVSMYADAYHQALRGAISDFTDRWPDIHVSVRLSDEPVDLLSEPYDVAFRISPLPDSAMVARKVLTLDPSLYAAPKFLDRFPAPATPDDLPALPCIILSRMGNTWELRKGAETKTVRVQPRFVYSSVTLVREMALGGYGIALLHKDFVAPHVAGGRLVRLLPDWDGPRHDVFIMAGSRQVPERVRIFVDYISSRAPLRV